MAVQKWKPGHSMETYDMTEQRCEEWRIKIQNNPFQNHWNQEAAGAAAMPQFDT